jgi:hypothetical protein
MNIFAKTGEFPSSCSVEDVNTSHQIRDQGGLLEFFLFCITSTTPMNFVTDTYIGYLIEYI